MTPATTTDGLEPEDAFLAIHIPGTSQAVRQLRRLVVQLNSTENADLVRVILIRGESGAGKNRLAEVIAAHRRWVAVRDTDADPGLEAGMEPLKDQYGEIHLPSLPETLVESELFGYVEGAFTGARKGGKVGLLGRDDRADILLDEVGDASKLLQAKLLAVVEHGRFRPVGGDFDAERPTSARLLLATNRDLETFVRADRFREDLYWRAAEFSVTVLPLRAQRENIPAITRYIHSALVQPRRGGLREPPELTPEELEWARQHDWPGNVRQLRHAVKRWLFEAGQQPLAAVVEALDREMCLTRTGSPTLAALVRQRLATILAGEAKSPGGPGEFVDEFTDQVKAAVHEWYRETQPAEADLRKLFAEGKIDSIRGKISQWGRKYGEGTA